MVVSLALKLSIHDELGLYDKMKSLITIKHGWSCASAVYEQTDVSLCCMCVGVGYVTMYPVISILVDMNSSPTTNTLVSSIHKVNKILSDDDEKNTFN